jgi:lipopolysaccharide cholinephosphotransferase
MDGTTAVLNCVNKVFSKTHQGIFIDIFPYDIVPDDQSRRNELISERDRLMNTLCHVYPFDFFHPLRSLLLLKYRSKFALLFGQFEDIFRKETIEDNQFVSCLSYKIDFEHFLRDKIWYKETIFLPFENVSMPVPIGYHQILTLQYGEDYMTPKKVSSDHGSFLVLDVNRSFAEYSSVIRARVALNRRNAYKRRGEKIYNRLISKFSTVRRNNLR